MYRLSCLIAGTLAKLYIKRFSPLIIGVTGNAGKTSAKEAIGAVLNKIKKVRVAGGNLNNELGLPFNIISDAADEYYEKGGGLFFGIKVFFKALAGLFGSDYPEVLVLEYGADRPGDIRRLAAAYKPHVSVITSVGDVPVHIEFFKDADEMADEKANLVKGLSVNDFAVLNHDDRRVLMMRAKTKAKALTYGFDSAADIRASDMEYLSNEEGRPLGVAFKLNQHSNFVPVRIEGSLGKSQAWSSAAAAAVGIALGMNLVEVSEALRAYHGPKGRLKVLAGIKNSHIIDDTYNASPASTRLALEVLRDVPSLRKIAVLGDMLELGEHTIAAHQETGRLAAEIADIIITVGSRAKLMAEAASGKLAPENIFSFETSSDAKLKVQELVKEHDLVLVKGSQGMRMEKIVEEIMAAPQYKKDLLVRQSRSWLRK